MPNKSKKQAIKPIILDTHIWLWLVRGDKRVNSTHFLNQIDFAQKNSKLFISIITVWEIGLLNAKNRIRLPNDCLLWVTRAIETSRVTLVPMTVETAIESSRLDDFHGDPADRIIVATAQEHQAAIATLDKKILKYSQKHRIKTITT